MFTNQCSKCGEVFETKNPKRVICPNCLYPEGTVAPRTMPPQQQQPYQQQQRPYQPAGGGGGYGPPRHQGGGGYGPPRHQGGGGYGPPRQGGGGYGPPRQGGYGPPRQGGGGYGPPRGQGGPRPGGYGPPRQGGGRPGGFGGPRGGGRPGGGFGGPRRGGPPKKLLVTKEQLIEIEKHYRAALPLPNPDIHEVIGEKIDLAPSKVFFGINLIRDKMKLPKLEYPKRKLAVTPEQLMAIETLYEPYLPVPPIGIHKIIAKQLKLDEWRVHVAIGLIRKNRNLNRWNEDRDDVPEEMREKAKKQAEEKAIRKAEEKAREKELKAARKAEAEAAKAAAGEEGAVPAAAPKPVKAAEAVESDDSDDEEVAEVKPKAVKKAK